MKTAIRLHEVVNQLLRSERAARTKAYEALCIAPAGSEARTLLEEEHRAICERVSMLETRTRPAVIRLVDAGGGQ